MVVTNTLDEMQDLFSFFRLTGINMQKTRNNHCRIIEIEIIIDKYSHRTKFEQLLNL